jgi:hypothetical protein
MGLSRVSADSMHIQQDMPITVVVVYTDQGFAGQHLDAQFLMQFTRQPPCKCFAGLQLTPGKLPQTTLVDMVGTAGDQHPTTVVGDRTYSDVDDFSAPLSDL